MSDIHVELRVRDPDLNTEIMWDSVKYADVMIRSYDVSYTDDLPNDRLEFVFRVYKDGKSLSFTRNELAQLIGYTP